MGAITNQNSSFFEGVTFIFGILNIISVASTIIFAMIMLTFRLPAFTAWMDLPYQYNPTREVIDNLKTLSKDGGVNAYVTVLFKDAVPISLLDWITIWIVIGVSLVYLILSIRLVIGLLMKKPEYIKQFVGYGKLTIIVSLVINVIYTLYMYFVEKMCYGKLFYLLTLPQLLVAVIVAIELGAAKQTYKIFEIKEKQLQP